MKFLERKGSLLVLVLLLVSPATLRAEPSDSLIRFDCSGRFPHEDPHILPGFDPSAEQFYVHVPANYNGASAFGLIVFIDADDQSDKLPDGWDKVLEQKKLLFVAPQKAGNDQPLDRRAGLGLLAVRGMEQKYKVDTARVYASGYSGGARQAGRLGFYAPYTFTGTIQCCGTDFYHAVPQVAATSEVDTNGQPYGLFDAAPAEVAAAKQRVRFVLITGSDDFRGPNIRDIYHGGFEKEGFAAKLIDVPGMGHAVCPPHVLIEALNFIENVSDAPAAVAAEPTTRPAPPQWMARDPATWPQILLTNEMRLADGTFLVGASGFLMRMPNGLVLGVTAKHCVGENLKVSDVKAQLRSWALLRPGAPSGRVLLTGWVEKVSDDLKPDGFAMLAESQSGPWPAQPLPVRSDPVEVGETVYLFAVPRGDPSPQHVYKGTVTYTWPTGEFAYQLSETPKSMGFSGAPIIDASGEVVGMHTTHFDNAPGKYQGLQISTILPLIQLPADTAAQTPKSPTNSTALQTPPPDPADAALRKAQLLIQNKVYDKAKQRLQEIIDTYPNTPAAAKAQQLLNDLQNQ